MNPRFPVYIISKGRWENRLTSRALERRKIPYHIVVEPQEFSDYAAVIDKERILVLPFSNLGQGSIPARNWVWEDSIAKGYKKHWILDDNIDAFYRLNNNIKYRTTDGASFCAIEDFVERYKNVAMSGMQYESLVKRKTKVPPFILNTRIYSAILLSNQIPHRWRGRYNEDTDLSLRILKDGFCTMLFQAFLADKAMTMKMKGGNTDQLYKQDEKFDGRLAMAQSLARQHPDVCEVRRKFGRWQHHVNYKPFENNKLIRNKEAVILKGNNEFGMIMKRKNGQ
ncbi:MAG: hypothetical protein CMP39_04270 [Rickettsiales bacterium]|nr:hypothetical protein [Rickettsiales bacterium]|tara:strand:+ start:1489 stop:2334 length:846 start_codon:yes stop_codon:yes gene_type:complete